MKIVYAREQHALVDGAVRRNPRFFTAPEEDVTAVAIVGDYPDIASAYRAVGVPVHEVDKEGAPEVAAPHELPDPDSVTIPADWQDRPWQERRALARALTADTVINGDQANAIIENELARRAFNGADPAAFDHDHSGKAGGSLPKAKRARAAE